MTLVLTRRLARLALPMLVFAFSTSASQAADNRSLSPHRAVYEITLDKAKNGAMADLSGRMVYELTGSECEGYTQTMRFVTRSTTAEGEATVNDMRSSTYEDMAANIFKFSSSQYRDDQQTDATSGEGKREPGGGSIKVDVEKPKKAAITINPKTLFPVQHSLALLDAARAGQSIFSADLYDGSEKGEKVFATTAVIGAKTALGKAPKLPAVKNAEKLESLNSWPISLSYFDKGSDKSDSGPIYELAFLFFENGVSQRLFIDYGEFSIRGALKDLTFLDSAPCNKKP